jgi:putative oxidoreductase
MHHLIGPYSDNALTLLRVVAGFLFLCHGAQKFGLIQDPREAAAPASRAPVTQQQPATNQPGDVGANAVGSPVHPTWAAQLRLPAGRTLVAGVIELFGGACIMVGLFTSSVSFVASGLMAFAYFLVHAPQGFYPLFNRGEPAVLFCFIWLYLSTRPPGRFALDNVLFKSRGDTRQELGRLPRAS